jgi:drug/metabolite transporter (DMT)-like permease
VRLQDHPRALLVAGAVTIAFSAILVRLADVSPSTAAIFRCAYALPLLAALAWREDRARGPRPWRERRLAAAGSVLLGADLIVWNHAIADVGAGLATVLGNLQVLFVPLLAWAVLGEHPSRRVLATLPLVMAGIVLISGALERGAYGANPGQGVVFGLLTGIAYAGFLLVLRASTGARRRVAGPLFDATAAAAVAAVVAGAVVGDANFTPSWPAHGWLALLAVSSQVVGWLLIAASLPRLPAALGSVLLTIQPVGSVVLGAVLLSEAPTPLQLAGTAMVLAGVVAVAAVPAAVSPLPARLRRRPRAGRRG